MMRRPLVLVSLLVFLAGCDVFGAPAPLVANPQWQPSDGPSVQFHAGRSQGQFQIDGVAQGVTSLDMKLLRQGQLIAEKTVSINSSAAFSSAIGPVQDGDEVTLQAPGYATAFEMTWPNAVTSGPALQASPAATPSQGA